jgi:hypothetical protein
MRKMNKKSPECDKIRKKGTSNGVVGGLLGGDSGIGMIGNVRG